MQNRLVTLLTLALFLTLYVSFSSAQTTPDACPVFIEQALLAVGENCGGLEQNSACYGYDRVAASFAFDVDEETFNAPSDRAALTELRTLQTSPLDLETGAWGVVVLNVQANIPNTLPGQAVTFILFGDTQMENRISPEDAVLMGDPVQVVVVSDQRVNLRSGPGTANNVIRTAANGEFLNVDGRNESGDWLRVVSEDHTTVWISSSLVRVLSGDAGALDALVVVNGMAQSPMQAFYFSTGLGVSSCFEAPNMVLIQTPKEVSQVTLTVNGAQIGVGSTILLIAESSDYATFESLNVMTDQLRNINVDDDVLCTHTSLIVLDGAVELNNRQRILPIGHRMESVQCYPDGFEGEAEGSIWANYRRLSQDELGLFEIVESVPENLLRYPVVIPSDDDIDRAITVRPTATPPPQAESTNPPGQPPQPTRVPPTTPPDQVDCSNFRATAPPDGGPVAQGPQTFYWDPAANVDAYQLDLTIFYTAGQIASEQLFRVGANSTNITVDLSSYASNEGVSITWFLQALKGSDGNFTTVCETPPRSNPIDIR